MLEKGAVCVRILGGFVQFIIALVAIYLVNAFVPGFAIRHFYAACMIALSIAVASWLVERLWRRALTPFGKGVIGFFMSVFIIGGAPFIVKQLTVNIIGLLLAALFVGVTDLFVPNRLYPLHKNKQST